MLASLRAIRLLPLLLGLATGCGSSSPPAADDGGVEGGTADDGGRDGGSVDDGGEMPDCPDGSDGIPSGRGEHVAFFDATRNRLLVFGGNTAAPAMCNPTPPHYEEAVWAYRVDCEAWERIEPNGPAPLDRSRMALAHDTTRNRVLLFGGRKRLPSGSYENYDEVWAFDLGADTWEKLTVNGSARPTPRNAAVAGYDESEDRLIVFGGNTSSSGLTYQAADDTWALDLASGTWTEITASGPSARIFAAGAVLDGTFYVYGGTQDFFGPILGDLWALDLSDDTWTEVGTDGAPRTRFAAQLLADVPGSRLLMLMGHDDTSLGNSNDVWAYDPAADTWTELHSGDQLNAMPGGFCDFPKDFVNMEPGSPERRHMFGAGIGPDALYVAMGKTDCGNVNDLWSMRLSDGSWQMLSTPSEGESCERRDETNCSSLCF